ncbi:MAG: DNA mismatch repair endonuclease MutL [Verrucomicrobiales bacterium]|nr:DNA mismatch repair endonuclease MutL [Verrucomicrobiales bacterium]
MGKIRLLSEALASQVAAGEVVERPSSVVKELVENSIDAGASNIEIRIQRGGIALIRVTDDGCGMNRDDALMCLERNATSKIRSKEDLAAICTLGFRGEAIPSIASVSKFRLTTREPDSITGTEIVINGGKVISVKDCGEQAGTQIEVRSLFFNLPARKKFLRTENTEFSHLEQVVRTQAIAHENIRFALVSGDRLVFQLPATTKLRERIAGLSGNDLASRLLELEPFTHNGITVRGFIGPPGMGRSDRKQQFTFLNGRPVEAIMLTRALREGYHTALMKGQYPVTFVFLEMDPTAVDVNVHPAKKEVRFHDGFGVQDAIVMAVQETLRKQMRRPVAGVGLTGTDKTKSKPQPVYEEETVVQPSLIPEAEQRSLRNDWVQNPGPSTVQGTVPDRTGYSPEVNRVPSEKSESATTVAETAPTTDPELPKSPPVAETQDEPEEDGGLKAEDYHILGVLGKLYVLMESKEGLVLMDQHGAHERVLFEEMMRRMETEDVPSQRLLTPITMELAPRDFDLISQNTEVLSKLGFGAEPFGSNTLKIDALPTFLKSDDPEGFIHNVIDEIRKDSDKMSKMRLGEDMVATTVCRHAIKANDPLHLEELQRLLEDLLKCDMPYCCPHGRPTLIQITYAELDRKFGRRV